MQCRQQAGLSQYTPRLIPSRYIPAVVRIRSELRSTQARSDLFPLSLRLSMRELKVELYSMAFFMYNNICDMKLMSDGENMKTDC